MPATRFIYLLLIALAFATTVFIGNFSIEPFSVSSPNIQRRRDRKGAIWQLYRRPSSDTTLINSSAINAASDDDCVNLSLIRKSKTDSNTAPLPLSVGDGVKAFVFFIGIGRSGHSIVASILDSHPHMVVSNELNLFKLLNTTPCAAEDKLFLFNQIWSKSYTQANTDLKDSSKGYTLAIDGLYQGSYVSHIDVIGDKMGGSTVALFLASPAQFESHLNKLRSLVSLPIKVLHVIRNPYDNIATKSLHFGLKLQYSKFAAIKKDKATTAVNHKLIDKQVAQYFQFYEASEALKHTYKFDTMELHNIDLIAHPKEMISKMCEFLAVHCTDAYLNAASSKVFNGVSKTRYNMQWKTEQILLVKENIWKFRTLHRYLDFDY